LLARASKHGLPVWVGGFFRSLSLEGENRCSHWPLHPGCFTVSEDSRKHHTSSRSTNRVNRPAAIQPAPAAIAESSGRAEHADSIHSCGRLRRRVEWQQKSAGGNGEQETRYAALHREASYDILQREHRLITQMTTGSSAIVRPHGTELILNWELAGLGGRRHRRDATAD